MNYHFPGSVRPILSNRLYKEQERYTLPFTQNQWTMKTVRFVVILFLWATAIVNSYSQQANSGKITYEFVLNLNGIPLNRSALLLFNKQQSIFYHSRGVGFVMVDKFGNQGDMNMSVTTVNDNSGQAALDGYMLDEEGNTYYLDYAAQTFTNREIILVSPHIYQEPRPQLNWQILPENKTINNLQCTKAQATFRGRTYTAWFSPEIAIPYGPWKLQGLPGLILEAADDTGEVRFAVKTIQIPLEDHEEVAIKAPQQGKIISYEEAKTIWQTVQRKMLAKANSGTGRNSESMSQKPLNLLEKF